MIKKQENYLIKTSEYRRRKFKFLLQLIGYLTFILFTILIIIPQIIFDSSHDFKKIMLVILIMLVCGYTLLFVPTIIYNLIKMILLRKSLSEMNLVKGKIIKINTMLRSKECIFEVVIDDDIILLNCVVYTNYQYYDMLTKNKFATLALNMSNNHCIFVDLNK